MSPVTHGERLEGRIVVVSPHLDDGVLSLGAAMSWAARRGARIELLTVFGCDPESDAPTGGWDRRGGHATEGESARARREEDRRACAILGVAPVWLPFGSVDYERHGDDDEIREAVEGVARGADTVLLPGFPVTHPDHRWLADTLARLWRNRSLGLYAEQPYAQRSDGKRRIPDWLEEAVREMPRFENVPVGVTDRFAKWRAIRQYRSQLPLLGMSRNVRRGPGSLARAAEAIAWVGARGRAPD